MSRILTAMAVLLFSLLLTGMGDLGGVPEGKVPQTEKNLAARLVDRQGTVTEVTRFSMDGNLFLEGERGRGDLTVPFENLRKVEFGPVAGERVQAVLHYRSGDTLDLQVRRRAVFYGDTGLGAYRIRAADLKSIEFL